MKIINVFVVIILLSNVLFSQVKKNHISVITDAKILFQENFEDTDFASRGWYDALKGNITSAEHIEGSGHSLECKFLKGERGPEGGTPGRHLFEETNEVYLSFYVKYSANYTGSNKPYHPHEFHFITNENSKWVGPAYTHLTTYIEQNEGEPLLAIQDGQNIDEDNIGVDLTNITENRAVAGCNGDGDGYGEGDCYLNGGVHWNGKQWRSGNKYFSDNPGKYYKNDWHFIEVYFKLNSIVDGKAIPDGVVKYWYDGEALIDHEDVMLRTGQFPNMKFNQFLIAPYIGDGSPIEQTMWIDDLTVATSRVNTQTNDTVPDWKKYPYHQENSKIYFPRDEGWHPKEASEWWYTSAHVKGVTTGKDYSFMLSYFYKPAFGFDGFRILNLSNDTDKQFFTDTKPCKYYTLGQDNLDIKAWVLESSNEEWVTLKDSSDNLIPFQYHIHSVSPYCMIDVNYNALKRPLMMGDSGFFYEGKSGYTYYYAQTMLEVKGTIIFNGIEENIIGTAWIDRQYGQFNPSEGENYEWFCLQLSNGMDMNFWNIFTDKNQIPDTSTYRLCSVYVNDSTDLYTSDFNLEREKYSFTNDKVMCYSQKWNFKYDDIDLTITTENSDNEVPIPFRFYEGSVKVEGTIKGKAVTGVGFAELLHSYSNPEISILSPNASGKFKEPLTFVWQVDNPDEGNPLYYDVEISTDNKKTFNKIAKRISDTSFVWDASGIKDGTECWVKIIGYSYDSTLVGTIESESSFIVNTIGVPQENYSKIKVYPNPFNESTNIKFEIKKPANVKLIVYDLLGNEISKIADEYKTAGEYNIQFNSKNIKSGIYYYVLQVGSEIMIGKVICVK